MYKIRRNCVKGRRRKKLAVHMLVGMPAKDRDMAKKRVFETDVQSFDNMQKDRARR